MHKLLVIFIILSSLLKSQTVLKVGTDWPIESGNQELSYQNKGSQIMSCASGSIASTGYPAWTNYYAGYMFKVNNTSTCAITVNCFEARFQGTSGYRIYTKTGTFIGFETLSGSWTLVGSVAGGVTGISTVTCSPIPIAVNVTIPAGQSQSFYLTRTDNLVANRHLYITGTGTAGTTIYASDANVQITEAEYLDVYFILQVGVRRPSFDMYYTKVCGVLPIELISFEGSNTTTGNLIKWTTATELNNDRFIVERSNDGLNWNEVTIVKGSGTSSTQKQYSIVDDQYKNQLNYYRIAWIDYSNQIKHSNMIVIDNEKPSPKLIKTTNLLGQDVDSNSEGIKIEFYSDGSILKRIN